jgi:hypothetical protein
MAGQDDPGVGVRSRRRRRTQISPSRSGDDWAASKAPVHDSPPRVSVRDDRERTLPPSPSEDAAKPRPHPSLHQTATRVPESSVPAAEREAKTAMPSLSSHAERSAYRRPGRDQVWEPEERRPRDAKSREDPRRNSSPRPTLRYRAATDARQSTASYSASSDSETDVTEPSADEREYGKQRRRSHVPEAPVVARRREDAHGVQTRREKTRGRETGLTESKDGLWMSGAKRAPSLTRDTSIERKHAHHKIHHHRHRRRSASVDTAGSQTTSRRSSKKHYESVHADRPPMVRRSHTHTTPAGSTPSLAQSVASSRRSSSFLGSFLGGGFRSNSPTRPIKMVECVVCLDEDIPSIKAAELKCGHKMCHSCLRRSFKLSLTDPQHMPPKCCNADHIPLRHVTRLFNDSFKKSWNKKYAEFSTRNRVYCPAEGCGEWIKPENIHKDSATGRKYGKCGQCKTKVCVACNGKWHSSGHCPKDEDTKKLLEQAKKEGWQRCHKCKAIVELKEGCNHMTW